MFTKLASSSSYQTGAPVCFIVKYLDHTMRHLTSLEFHIYLSNTAILWWPPFPGSIGKTIFEGMLCHFLWRHCLIPSEVSIANQNKIGYSLTAWLKFRTISPIAPPPTRMVWFRRSNNNLIIKNSPHVFISEESIALWGSCQYLFSTLLSGFFFYGDFDPKTHCSLHISLEITIL